MLSVITKCISDSPLLRPVPFICYVTHSVIPASSKTQTFPRYTETFPESEVKLQMLHPSVDYLCRI